MGRYKNKLWTVREELNAMLGNAGLPEITQGALAKAVGVTRQAIFAIESEKAMPSYPVAIRIFDLLKRHGTKVVPSKIPCPTKYI